LRRAAGESPEGGSGETAARPVRRLRETSLQLRQAARMERSMLMMENCAMMMKDCWMRRGGAERLERGWMEGSAARATQSGVRWRAKEGQRRKGRSSAAR